jgi:hypothetical protein
VPSSDFLKSGKAFNATCKLLKDLEILSHRVNAILEFIDPDHYKEVKKFNAELLKHVSGAEALSGMDPLLYEGREVIFNRESAEHIDLQDPPFGWAILCAFGDSTGGWVHFRHTGLWARYDPGDILAIRGRIMPHSVSKIISGTRISIPHFTHASVWRSFGMESAVFKLP